ncbi:2-dehydropantoate 2-reductase [Lampropedia cohaerens]|uniref:2-dehydropantoate 2-reductase n=2 Tax=Lampropedia cohaerens TaxID=1610491 RepID=A0A0U1PXG7_9BURK|nr:2-dehydropantoate 2-reductase [Lampropedia cohaerens]
MRIGVMGAGAVGCYYGALLARAGHAVTLVGRPALVEAVATDGLRVSHTNWDAHVPLAAVTDAAALADADLVLLCVKSADSETAARALAKVLRPGTAVLSLQNGVDNPERIAPLLATQTVVPGVVYVAAEMAGPGHVLHHGRGELITGPWPGCEAVVAAFAQAGIPLTIDADVRLRQWNKLIVNCAYNALSAITQLPYGRLLQTGEICQVMTDVVNECVQVAQASGLALTHPGMDSVLGLAASMPEQRSSTAQDLARGKPTEIDHLNGYVARKGAELGIATPVNRTLAVTIKLLEARGSDSATLH